MQRGKSKQRSKSNGKSTTQSKNGVAITKYQSQTPTNASKSKKLSMGKESQQNVFRTGSASNYMRETMQTT